MGNSNGNLQEYFDVIRSSLYMQGGFLREWVDQGIKTNTPDGRVYYAYAGDLDGLLLQHDEKFCVNGLVAADRSPHQALYEVKKVYSKIQMKPKDIDKGIVAIQNLYDFTNLDQFLFVWRLTRNEVA